MSLGSRDSTGRRIDGDVGRLHAVLSLDEVFERAVHSVQDRGVAAKVGGETALDAILRFDYFFDDFEVGLDIRAAKSVDRLLRIADDENLSGDDFYLTPVLRRMTGFSAR